MIRWSYLVPRLVLLAVVCGVAWLALNPVLRWSLICAGRSATGAPVEIGGLRTSLSQTQIRLTNVHLVDPNCPSRDAIQAAAAVLNIDTQALLRRHVVVKEGQVTGIQVGARRAASGGLDTTGRDGAAAGWIGDQMAQAGERWLAHASENLQHDLEEEFESVQLAKQLQARWPLEYASVRARSGELRGRAGQVVRLLEYGPESPLRAAEVYQEAAHELEILRQESLQLREELNRLGHQAKSDRTAIDRARDRDIERIREKLQLENLDAQALTEYLLGPELSPHVNRMVQWIQWGRQFVPSDGKSTSIAPGRGLNMFLAGSDPSPDFLAERLLLSGNGRLHGQDVSFSGTATDLTSQPKMHGKPATIEVKTQGTVAMSVQAVLDRTQPETHDRLSIRWPSIPQSQRQLGRPGRLSVTVSPGTCQMCADFQLRNDQLTGEIHVRQDPVNLQLAGVTGSDQALPGLSDRFAQLLASVRHLDGEVQLSGTLQNPKWQLHSNLGPALADGLNTAVRQEMELQAHQLVARVEREVAAQMAGLDATLAAQEHAVRQQLSVGEAEIGQLSQALVGRLKGGLSGLDSKMRSLFLR